MKVDTENTFEDIPLTSDLESPGSCSVDSDCLQQTSSGESYNLCSEDSFIDDDYSDEEIAALTDEAVEIRTCRLGASRFLDPWLHTSEETVDVCALIRENLQKQQELLKFHNPPSRSMSWDSSSNSRHGTPPCSPPHRLLPTHRARVVGWMREVCEELRLDLGTFFAAISIFDRYVAAAKILPPEGILQLLALTCMSLAVKYHEKFQIPAAVWLSLAITSSGKYLYQPTDLQRFEWNVLQTIGWRLHQPTTLTFVQHYMACLERAERTSEGTNKNHQAAIDSSPNSVDGSDPKYEESWSTDVEEFTSADCEGGTGAGTPGGAEVKRIKEAKVTNRPPLPEAFMKMALHLAEVSIMYGMFQSYEHSTTAMACLTIAERLVPISSAADADRFDDVNGGSASSGLLTSVSATVSGRCRVPLDRLAPRFATCVMALEKCYGLLLLEQSA